MATVAGTPVKTRNPFKVIGVVVLCVVAILLGLVIVNAMIRLAKPEESTSSSALQVAGAPSEKAAASHLARRWSAGGLALGVEACVRHDTLGGQYGFDCFADNYDATKYHIEIAKNTDGSPDWSSLIVKKG